MRRPLEPGEEASTIVDEEVGVLARVHALAAKRASRVLPGRDWGVADTLTRSPRRPAGTVGESALEPRRIGTLGEARSRARRLARAARRHAAAQRRRSS